MRQVSPGQRLIVAAACVASTLMPLSLIAQKSIGITVFEDINFKGRSTLVERDTPNLRAIGIDRQISSFRLPPGESWEVCAGVNYSGRCQVFKGDTSDLRRSGWNDNIMSMRRAGNIGGDVSAVPRGSLELYSGQRFTGRRIVVNGENPDFRKQSFNDRALSLRSAPGEVWEVCFNIKFDDCRVVDGDVPDLERLGLTGISSARYRGRSWQMRPSSTLEMYAGTDFSGERLLVNGAEADLRRANFSDRAMSLRVPRGQSWEICNNVNFDDCRVVDHDVADLNTLGLLRRISSVRPHRLR
jgi:hypothetical protein